jgi:tetratricopeptide (TPR) repeat protein
MPGVPELAPAVQAVHYVAAKPDPTALIAEAYGRGEFCMKAGADQEAIAAFREVVKLDATFSDAWRNLAVLYERQGDDEKALEAFRNSKKATR